MAKTKKAKKAKQKARTATEMLSSHPDSSVRLVAAAFDMRKPYAMELALRHVMHYRAEEERMIHRAARFNGLADTMNESGDVMAMVHGVTNYRPMAHAAMKRADAYGRCCQAIEAVMIAFEKRAQTWREDEGEQPVSRAYPKRDVEPILDLEQAGKISKAQAGDAREISAVFHATTKPLFSKIANWAGAGGGRAPTDWMTARMALKHRHRYKPWVEEIQKHRIPLAFIVEIVIDGYALSAAADHHRMSHATGLTKLRKALSLYGRARRSDPTDYEHVEELV